MQYSSLDTIVKGQLINRGYSLHYYLQFLKHASDCLREMAFDDLKIINSKALTVTTYGAITLPCDFQDWIRVGIQNGQYLKPLNQSDGFNRMYNYNTNGQPTQFPESVNNNSDAVIFGIPFLSFYTNSYNSRGENTGGLYGFTSDGAPMTFELFRERGEIQMSQQLGASLVVLDYIGDGRSLDNASKINTYAESSIESYIDYAMAESNRNIGANEKDRLFRKYVRQREILRGRMNDLDTDGIINIFRKNYTATVKS